MLTNNIHLIGYASGLAAATAGCEKGPDVLQHSPYLNALQDKGINLQWEKILSPNFSKDRVKLTLIAELCQQLAILTANQVINKNFFTVLGGDHSSAIGTWSGAFHAIKDKGPLGLIWIDAHMDSHTEVTTPSGNIHGMSVACLLGVGAPELVNILDLEPKVRPEHLCLIGVRSFEREEAELLKDLNVRVYFMEDVRKDGLISIMQEAVEIVSKDTVGFGVSIDIDSIDPKEAPGTGVKEPFGISANELYQTLQNIAKNPNLLGIEIAEFDPSNDVNHKTEELISNLIAAVRS